MNKQLSIEDRAEGIYRVILSLGKPRAVFIVGGSVRSCDLKYERFERAMVSSQCEFVGVYDSRVHKAWLVEDITWSMGRYRAWRL